MAVKDYFKVLGVAQGASVEEVRKAYRHLSRDNHPDKFTDREEKRKAEGTFADMTEAFNVLTNAERRKAWEEEVRLSASGESSAEREAKGYYKAGLVKLNEGRAAEAVKLFKAALHLDSGPSMYHAGMAKALEKTQAYGEAARSWDEAIKKEPYNAKHYRAAGACLEKAGMAIRARRMYEASLKWEPNDKSALEALARLGAGDKGEKKGFLSSMFKKP